MEFSRDDSLIPEVFKPHEYDPLVGIDIDAAIEKLLAKYGVDSVERLPLSAFNNYTASRDTLNIHQQLKGVTKYIGNDLMYLSAGDGTYTTGTLTTPDNPARNLLNNRYPTINMVPSSSRATVEQIGGMFLPKHTTPLTYASFKHKPFYLTDKLSPGTVYVFPDPAIYGGTTTEGEIIIDHIEDLSWVKTPPIIVGMQGRIRDSNKIPLYNGYTSKEQSIGYPLYGTSRYTDNFDFWTGSVSGDIWANQDVYPLKEANKYDLLSRGEDLLTDICDIPYKWKTDAFGNEYVIYKLGTEHPKKTAGGSDTTGDGKDDQIQPGLGDPDYYSDDGGVEPVFTETGVDGGGSGLGDVGNEISDGESPVDETGEEEDDDTDFYDYEFDEEGNVTLTSCRYWLDGGGSLSPTVTAVQLDQNGGAIDLIVDGGWRVWDPADNPSDNQVDTTNTPSGFVDLTRLAAAAPTFDSVTDTATWFPNYAYVDAASNESEPLSSFRNYPRIDSRPTACSDSDQCNYTLSFGISGDVAYRDTVGRKENVVNHRMIIADGGWRRYGTTTSFFQTKCDRAAYIVTTYGGDEPDFGQNVFACKMFRITFSAKGYTGSTTAREWYKSLYGENDGFKRYVEDYAYALWRGPLDFTKHYNPIDASINYIKNKNYLGTKKQLLADKQPPTRYDYLTEYEAYLMRISPIEGSGAWELNQDELTYSFLDRGPNSSRKAGIYSSPDIFYYVSGGDINGVLYSDVSASTSYIQSPATTDEKIILDDVLGIRARGGERTGGGKATQFPQIPWDIEEDDPYQRDYMIPLSGVDVTNYYGLDCDTVCEYQFFDKVYVSCNNTVLLDYATITLNRDVSDDHPETRFRGEFYRSKRGYFPPPVGQLRRFQTHPLAMAPAQVGLDRPIGDNFLPDTDGFYVHDVWDAGGFHVIPGIEETEFTEPAPPEAPPPEIPSPTIPAPDDPTLECGEFTEPNQIGWRRAQLPDGSYKCYPILATDGGGCTGCVTLSGIKFVSSCGDYTRYDVTIITPVPNPCGSGDVPHAHIAQLVKRSSDAGDSCIVSPASSLWVQKHRALMASSSDPFNVFYRNTQGDSIGPVTDFLPGLVSTATNIGFDFTRSLVDFDIVYDHVIMRQTTNTGMDTMLFDQIDYNIGNDTTSSGDRGTFFLQVSAGNKTEQLISPFLNEDDNILLAGAIRYNNNKIYPEIHALDLSVPTREQVFPPSDAHPILDEFELPSTYTLVSVDPGEFAYNSQTDHYTVTYLGEIENTSTGNKHRAIFNTVLYMRGDIIKLQTTDMYVTDSNNTNDIKTSSEVLKYTETATSSVNAAASEFEFTLQFTDLVGIDTGDATISTLDILYIDIDWGDGETTTIWSDLDSRTFKSTFQRYGRQRVGGKPATILSDKTVIFTGSHPQAPRVPDTSVANHSITHTYDLQGGEAYTVNVVAHYNDNSTVFEKNIDITSLPYGIENTVKDVKLLRTKLFTSPDQNEKLLLTLETQSPRYVTHNTIDI